MTKIPGILNINSILPDNKIHKEILRNECVISKKPKLAENITKLTALKILNRTISTVRILELDLELNLFTKIIMNRDRLMDLLEMELGFFSVIEKSRFFLIKILSLVYSINLFFHFYK